MDLPTDTEYVTVFFIEDTSPLSIYYDSDNGETNKIQLGFSKQFMRYLRTKPKVDIVIVADNNDRKKVVVIDTKNLDEYENKAIDYEEKEWYALEPHVIGTVIPFRK